MNEVEITYYVRIHGADGGYRAEAFDDEARAVEAAERLGDDTRVLDVHFRGDEGLVEAARAAYDAARDAR